MTRTYTVVQVSERRWQVASSQYEVVTRDGVSRVPVVALVGRPYKSPQEALDEAAALILAARGQKG